MDPAEEIRKQSAPDLNEPPRPRLHRRKPRRRRNESRFQTGKVLATSLSVWWSRLIPFSMLTVIVFAPYVALHVWANLASPATLTEGWWMPLDMLLSQLLTAVVSATVMYGVFQRLRGRPVSIGVAVSAGLSRLPSGPLLALVMGLIMAVCLLPIFFMALAASYGGATDPAFTLSLAGLSLVSMVLVMFVSCALFVALAACVVEQPGVFASIRRSLELTKGFRLKIFLILIALAVFGAVVGGIFAVSLSTVVGTNWIWVALLLITLIQVSIQAVVSAVVYHDLRCAVDGMDAEQLAAIFD